jgi:hypothetical protein
MLGNEPSLDALVVVNQSDRHVPLALERRLSVPPTSGNPSRD